MNTKSYVKVRCIRMTTRYDFVIPGQPVAHKRPRFTRGRVYSAHGKDLKRLRGIMVQAMKNQSMTMITDIPVAVDLGFYMAVPKYKRKKLDAKLIEDELAPVATRPDVDNLSKLVLDAMNETVIKDDGLVFAMSAAKTYSNNPRTVVTVVVPNNYYGG